MSLGRISPRRIFLALLLVGSVVAAGLVLPSKSALADDGEFFLQVSPSPLVVTMKPGETKSFDLKIRNASSKPENLAIAPRSFEIDDSGEIKLDDTKTPPEIGEWTSFSAPKFTVQPGEWYVQKVTIAIPKEAGFSYSFALSISRQEDPLAVDVGRKLKGSVAIFTLVNIDKPGATRTLELDKLSVDKSFYEYLPATLNVRLKNTGNSIVRPSGNLFIQRGDNDKDPIGTLPLNKNSGYILPGKVRTLAVDWDDGFPVERKTTDSSGAEKKNLEWNWGNLSHIRFGRYTAKVVAIYNDGTRDIPVTGEVSFWVIPWKLLLILLVIILLIGAGIWSITSKAVGLSKRQAKRGGTVKFRG
jgi:hypothetical protein